VTEPENSEERHIERPDLDALRETYHAPSRWELQWERLKVGLKSRTFWTVVMAIAIVAVLVIGYIGLTS
jgi:hypothetical protein